MSESTSILARRILSCIRRDAKSRGQSTRVAARPNRELFQALRNISFDVQPGEIVGVVGRNGAGKSTFLKILCRITPPTAGRVEIRGRIGSLLEVGTGFHPELTGRENIYLNGAILGMNRKQIARDFDAIVAFAEIDRFLDTPVKRYSSGMYVRLAFAVASHLEPDVLIVDEVLAVGDSQFQKKCLGKMNEVRKNGRTVLFVSHNMVAVRTLCTRAVLLEKGELTLDSGTEEVVRQYLANGRPIECSREIPEEAERITNQAGRIRRVSVCNLNGEPASQLCLGEAFRVNLECELFEEVQNGIFEVSVSTRDGMHVLLSTSIDGGISSKKLGRGKHVASVVIKTVLLPREYVIDVGVHHADGETVDYVPNACDIEVLRIGLNETDDYPWPTVRGHVRASAQWNCNESLDSH